MPRTSSEELFDLVKSLSKAEKAHFNMFTSAFRSGQQNEQYVRLFKVLDKAKTYDEVQILEKLKLNKSLLPDLKNYLHKRILFSLEVYYNSKSPRAEVVSLLEQTRILMTKSLFIQARKKALKAVKLSKKASLPLYTVEALELYLFTYWRPIEELEIEQVYKEIFDELKELNIQIQEYFDIKQLHAEMYLLGMKSGRNLGVIPKKMIQDHISQYHWLINDKNAQSKVAQLVLLRQRYFYHLYLLDNQEQPFIEAIGALFREEPLLKKVYYRDYLMYLYNTMWRNVHKISLEEVDHGIKEVSELISVMHESEISDNAIKFYIIKVKWYISRKLYKNAIQFYKSTPMLYENVDTTELVERFHIKSVMIDACLQSGEYKLALSWINGLLNEGYKTTRADLFAHARVQLLIAHFALGNYDYLSDLAMQARRFVAKYLPSAEVLNLLISFFKKNEEQFYHPAERRKVLLQLQEQLEILKIKPENNMNLTDYTDYIQLIGHLSKS